MEMISPYHLFGNVRGNSYVRVDPVTGLVAFKGLARPYIGLWLPLTAMEQASAPDYDGTNFGYLFPNNDDTEFLTANIALDHDYAPGTSLYPRILWHQAASTPPVWKISYRWLNLGEQVGAFTTATATGQEYTYIQGTIQQVSYFPTIPGAGKKMGSVLQVKIYRDDAVLAGDSLAIAFGVFKRVDSLGSQSLTLKSIPGAQVSSSPSSSVSSSPSSSASSSPSSSPTTSPSVSISGSPTTSPSSSPTTSPSVSVSNSPSASISGSPTTSPSASVSNSPTTSASASASSSPSAS